MSSQSNYKKFDWWLIGVYLLLTLIGWLNIFSAVYQPGEISLFDTSTRYGMQSIWIIISYLSAFVILFLINPRAYRGFSGLIYVGSTLLLILVVLKGVEVSGSKSWLQVGPIRVQPAEFAKLATAIALAAVMSTFGYQIKQLKWAAITLFIIFLPPLLIIMQKETGSALVFAAFLLVLYLEGMSGWILVAGIYAIFLFLITLGLSPFIAITLLIGSAILLRGVMLKEKLIHSLVLLLFIPIAIYAPKIDQFINLKERSLFWRELMLLIVISPLFIYHLYTVIKTKSSNLKQLTLLFFTSLFIIFSVEFFFEKVLQPHQKIRIENLLGINVDLKGAGYNVHQSKIAIGSGGFAGKGFLKGTQTKYNFVPEQSTDFIFCTIGEGFQ